MSSNTKCSWCDDGRLGRLQCEICGPELCAAVHNLGREISSVAPLALWILCWDLDSNTAEIAASGGFDIGCWEQDSKFVTVSWEHEVRRHAMTFAPAFSELLGGTEDGM